MSRAEVGRVKDSRWEEKRIDRTGKSEEGHRLVAET